MQKPSYILIILFIIFASSCKENHSNHNAELKSTKGKLLNDIAKQKFESPQIIYLSDSPKCNYSRSNFHVNKLSNKHVNAEANNNSTYINENGHDFFETYSSNEGLSLSTLLSSFADKEGNLWFATAGMGVDKFTGKSFTNFSSTTGLANNTVVFMAQDKEGNYWFATDGGGISVYNGVCFTNFTEQDGLASNSVRSIIVDPKDGSIWLATSGGGLSKCLYNRKNKIQTHFVNYNIDHGLSDKNLRCLAFDNQGNLWIGTQQNGVSKFDGQKFTNYTKENGLAGNNIRSIVEDDKGNLWIGTDDGGISILDISSLKENKIAVKNITMHNGLPSNSIRALLKDKSGNIWIGTSDMGISKYCLKNGIPHFTNFSMLNGLSNNNISSIVEDKAGNIWFSTKGGGVCKYNGESFCSFTTEQGLSNNLIWGIEEIDEGSLLFASDDNGISQLNLASKPFKFSNFNSKNGLPSNSIICIKKDSKGNIWFGSNGEGVSKYDGNGFTNYTTKQGLADNLVTSIFEDKNHHIWLGTGANGVSKLDFNIDEVSGKSNPYITNYSIKQGLADEVVLSIKEDKRGELWIGTQKGLSHLKKGPIQSGESCFTNYTVADGLSGNGINCISEDRYGNLYLGTEKGLSIVSIIHDNPEEVKIKSYTKANGLPQNSITNIVHLPNGKVVLGTYNGLAIFNPELPLDKNRKLAELEIFNKSTGYPIKDINEQGSMHLDSKGVIWAGTGDDKIGLIRFDYQAIKRNLNIPNVVIEQIKLNEQEMNWYSLPCASNKNHIDDSLIALQQEIMIYGTTLNDKERSSFVNKYSRVAFDSIQPYYNIPQHLVLPYRHNQITIEYNCIDVSRHNMVNYQYMLEGYDKEWSPVLKKTEAIFGNMSEGHYIFKLKAQSPDGIWSKPIEYAFTVLPPWYRTWWAYLLYVLIIGYAIRYYFRWRTKGLKRRGEHLHQIVRERTAEVLLEKKEVEKQKEEAEKQYKRSEELLLNILPLEIADELKLNGKVAAKQFQNVTVLLTDFVNFTGISQTLSPQNLVSEVHLCYTAFDEIIERHGLEKIKTIGDAYLAVSGIPHPNQNHAVAAVEAARDIITFIQNRKQQGGLFDIRIGLHSGPVVAGIVGVKKFAYDIWGDTVNTTARMEQSSTPGKINLSGATYQLIKNQINCIHRGKIVAKNKGEIDMYYVETTNN